MLFYFCMRGCGRIERPAFPAPSDLQEAGCRLANLAQTRGEIAKLWLQMTLFEIRVYENSWRERAIWCVVPAKAGTHNHRC